MVDVKTVGIIGGIGPESTIAYYRKLVAAYLDRGDRGHYPQVIINSIDMTKLLELIGSGDFDEVAVYLAAEVKKLELAGADFAVLASNTPHIVFDRVRQLSSLPLLSIVEATCQKVAELGLERVALIGTKFTMQGGFYSEVLGSSGIELTVPDAAEQDFIHEKYMSELVAGLVVDETRAGLIDIIEKIKDRSNVQGLILGGTELSAIVRAGDVEAIEILDTTEIHVESILQALIRDRRSSD